jgi:large subunit ribosomal protein L13
MEVGADLLPGGGCTKKTAGKKFEHNLQQRKKIATFATPKLTRIRLDVNPLSTYKTVSANKATVNKKWYVVDAEGQTLGRMASRIAHVIRGKNKADFTPHVDCGDYVIVINAEKVQLTGNKMENREYLRHTGYPGGQRSTLAKDMKPTKLIEDAVRGMLPKNRLGRRLFTNLHVYEGGEHNHQAQKPETLKFEN